MRKLLLAAATATAALALAPAAANATILLFDVDGGVTNHDNMHQTYGDNVAAAVQAGHAYGVGAEGFTPNVVVDYGVVGEDPALWTTGYGDLTNVYFNDADGDTTFTTTFTADAGFLVDLYSFDLAWYFDSSQEVQGFTIRDLGTNAVLHSQGPFVLAGGAAHTSFDFATPLSANQLQLVVDLSGLGSVSDDVGMDNVRFGQHRAPTAAIPEPATWAMMIGGFFGAGTMMRRRRALAAA